MAAILVLLAVGCATRYSPGTVRKEIVRQRGVDPRSTFELNLGRLTTYMIKSALGSAQGDTLLDGLEEFQLAVYEVPPGPDPVLDVTRFGVRGWEPVVRAHSEQRSLLILVRSGGRWPWSDGDGVIGDLVVVGAGRQRAVYGRLQGTLSSELPAQLGQLFRDGGPERIVDTLSALADAPAGP